MEDDIQNYLSTVMFRGTPCRRRWFIRCVGVSFSLFEKRSFLFQNDEEKAVNERIVCENETVVFEEDFLNDSF